MAFSLTHVATNLVSDLGYAGLSVGLVTDSFGVPIPSEVLIPAAVVDSRHGQFNVWLIIVVGTLAQLVGGMVSYWIGRKGGLPAVERFGRYVLISRRDLDRAHRAFSQHGRWMVGVGRCVPLVRGLIGYPAGASEMPVRSFALWTAVGALAWTSILVGLGELLSNNINAIDQGGNYVLIGVAVVLVIAFGLHIRRARRDRGSEVEAGRN
jgi:membrane protein DedA with SNARE-associated domain